MSSRARQAALRIALVLEEFTPTEVSEAVNILRGLRNEELLVFLERTRSIDLETAGPGSNLGQMNARSGKSKATRSTKLGRGARTTARLLGDLSNTDPEKHAVLSRFATRIQEGFILATIEDIRRFGAILSKYFSPGKSRTDAIARLLEVLAKMDIKAIDSAVEKVPLSNSQDNSFQRLADRIISGGTAGPART